MKLDTVKSGKEIKKKCKCFKCEKPEYIRRFCRSKAMKVLNLKKLKNDELLILKESQKKEL